PLPLVAHALACRCGLQSALPRAEARGGTLKRAPGEAGVTLIEVLIAVTLLALLSVAMLFAMRVGISAMAKSDARLMENRRISGAQRIIEQEIAGFVPTMAICGAESDGPKTAMPFFQGEPAAMRFVSTFSLQQGWRGMAQLLEFTVIPGQDNRGVRLVV